MTTTEAQPVPTAPTLERETREPIYAIAVDGPRSQPNGHLLVEVLRQDTQRHRFVCKVVSVMDGATGRTSQPGDVFVVDTMNLFLHWKERS